MLVPPGKEQSKIDALKGYARLARLDHSTKHIFILPGILLAYVLRFEHSVLSPMTVLCGLGAAICIASANYTINEWLDREFDKLHPTKSQRASVQMDLRGSWVYAQWFTLVISGLFFAAMIGLSTFIFASLFALQGIVYNVRPLRLKDVTFFDVISESVNNPLRLVIGWTMVDPTSCPPLSVILAYWLGGGFLMAAKRYSEYLEFTHSHGKELLSRYRASFVNYSEVSLNVSCLIYALLSAFFFTVFLLKYRIEYILVVPLIAALFGEYLAMSLRPNSSAQRPEKLYKERRLNILIGLIVVVSALASFVDMPSLEAFTEQRFMSFP
jgi:4-hydroxybenzoate polyprenyltransferase